MRAYTPSEAERIGAIVRIAQRADAVGLNAYLASERSSWLTGRTIGAMGFEVLYGNHEPIR